MSPSIPTTQYMDRARALIREKGLVRRDLVLLEEVLRLGVVDGLLLATGGGMPVAMELGTQINEIALLKKHFGVFLVFLNQLSQRPLGGMRESLGLVLQHSLIQLGQRAQAAHRALLNAYQEPDWVLRLVEMITSLRSLAIAMQADNQMHWIEQWKNLLMESGEQARGLFQVLAQNNPTLHRKLNQEMKALNRALREAQGVDVKNQALLHLRRLEAILAEGWPEKTRTRVEPLLLVQHVAGSLHMSLMKPLDGGVQWSAMEQVRGSLEWLWRHLGWTLPQVTVQFAVDALPQELRQLLSQLKSHNPPVFKVMARALASHLTALMLVEQMEPPLNASLSERYASVPLLFVLAQELGRLAEGPCHPRHAEALPKSSQEALLLGVFLRQAVLSLLQDQAAIYAILEQALGRGDLDQITASFSNIKALINTHQRQAVVDLIGLFSPDLRKRLSLNNASSLDEGDSLRQGLHRLWETLSGNHQKIQLHLALEDMPRLALTLGQTQSHVAAFRRSADYLLIRSLDRQEFDKLSLGFMRLLESPEDVVVALRQAVELLADLVGYLALFLMRINARISLIKIDLTYAKAASDATSRMLALSLTSRERGDAAHLLIQTVKPLAVRDAQTITLLKRWIKCERSGKDTINALHFLLAHLDQLSKRLAATLD